MSKKQKRYFLTEEEIPTQWYNIQADMVNKPMPTISSTEPIRKDSIRSVVTGTKLKHTMVTISVMGRTDATASRNFSVSCFLSLNPFPPCSSLFLLYHMQGENE